MQISMNIEGSKSERKRQTFVAKVYEEMLLKITTMDKCFAIKEQKQLEKLFRTTRRSTRGAARGARTPCATSRGRWFAA
jgi:hypothetical protein